jgi:tetratricopeptide (TPR) repeat protein
LRALDLRRQASDKAGSAKESDSMGILFAYEGRYGAALNARKDAMNGFRELQDRSYWMAESLGGYGYALAQVGQYTQAANSLLEALTLARELKNDSLAAQIIAWQGDADLYQGNAKAAQRLYSQASQMLSKSSNRDLQLEVKLKIAEMSLAGSVTRKAVSEVQRLADEAASFGLKYTSIDAALFAAKGLIDLKDYTAARQALVNLLAASEKLGARPLIARSHFLTGTLLRLEGKSSDAVSEYRQSLQAIQDMQKDAGPKLMDRSDMKAMLEESGRWAPQS